MYISKRTSLLLLLLFFFIKTYKQGKQKHRTNGLDTYAVKNGTAPSKNNKSICQKLYRNTEILGVTCKA